MVAPELSVVIPLRDRAGLRLENCLTSLRWQDLPGGEPEVILSDFGSSPEPLEQTRALAARYRAAVVHTTTDEMWNRARALNVGIQSATGEFVLNTDCDMIFAPNFLAAVLDALHATRDNALVLCCCRDLPQDLPRRHWQVEDFGELLRAAPLCRKGGGTGACQAARRQWFVDIRGYDEKYVYWGYEDKDLVRRAERSALLLRWIHDQTQMVHQWHPTTKHDRVWLRRWNRLRYRVTGGIVRKNRSGWGNQRG